MDHRATVHQAAKVHPAQYQVSETLVTVQTVRQMQINQPVIDLFRFIDSKRQN